MKKNIAVGLKKNMSCKAHSDCEKKGSYCTVEHACANLQECFIMKDSITKTCPLEKCASENDCKDTKYCNGNCYCAQGKCFPRKMQGMSVCDNAGLRGVLGFPDC